MNSKEAYVKSITCSLSEKIQHEGIGGKRYESSDLFESESEQVPSSMDFDEVQTVWRELRRRVEGRIEERKQALINKLSQPF